MKPSETRKKCPYVERDISWMYFNQRILLEAARPEVPLLERLTFLGIYSNNLDEFFRVRVATLNRIIEYDDKNIQKEQEIAAHTLKQIGKLHNRYYEQFEETFASIMEELKKETGVSALDVAKSLIDHGIHPPTMYFPLIVHEALMFEPTETESRETLDEAAEVMRELYQMAHEDGAQMHDAPHHGQIKRPDEVLAARQPVLRYRCEQA